MRVDVLAGEKHGRSSIITYCAAVPTSAGQGRRPSPVIREEDDGSITVIASSFQGRRLNRPSDVVVKSDGACSTRPRSFCCWRLRLGDEGRRGGATLPHSLIQVTLPSNPPPHPRLVGSIRIAELALQIALLPHDHAHIDHPQERHHE